MRRCVLAVLVSLSACAGRSSSPSPAVAPVPETPAPPTSPGPNPPAEPALYHATYGDASPTFVFLHGGPGYNAALFEATTAEALGERHRVVVYDRRGCGRNPEAAAPAEDFTFAKAVADLDEVLQDERDPILVAHSFGGAIALAYLQARPKFAGRVVLVNAPISYPRSLRTIIANCRAVYETNGDAQQLGFLEQLEAMDPASAPYAGFAFMHGMGCGLYEPSAPTEHARALKARAMKHPAAASFADSRQAPFLGFHQSERYTTLELGALVETHAHRISAIYGSEDRIISPDDRAFLRRTLGDRYVEIPGAAHNTFIDQQPAFLEALGRTASLSPKRAAAPATSGPAPRANPLAR